MLAQTVFRMNDVILGWQMLQLTNSAFWVGLVAFASGIPLLIFSPFTGILADQRERHHIVAIGLGVIVFAFTRNTSLALTLAFLLGVIDGVFLTLSNVIFQTHAPDSIRGRVLGAWGMVWGILPFTALFAGLLTDKIGVVYVIAGSGVLCLLFTIGMTIASPHLRELG